MWKIVFEMRNQTRYMEQFLYLADRDSSKKCSTWCQSFAVGWKRTNIFNEEFLNYMENEIT